MKRYRFEDFHDPWEAEDGEWVRLEDIVMPQQPCGLTHYWRLNECLPCKVAKMSELLREVADADQNQSGFEIGHDLIERIEAALK